MGPEALMNVGQKADSRTRVNCRNKSEKTPNSKNGYKTGTFKFKSEGLGGGFTDLSNHGIFAMNYGIVGNYTIFYIPSTKEYRLWLSVLGTTGARKLGKVIWISKVEFMVDGKLQFATGLRPPYQPVIFDRDNFDFLGELQLRLPPTNNNVKIILKCGYELITTIGNVVPYPSTKTITIDL